MPRAGGTDYNPMPLNMVGADGCFPFRLNRHQSAMSKPLWRWPELCRAVGLDPVDGPDVTGISIDSRTTEPGDLFIALTGDPGPRFNASQRSDRDGHDFIPAALAAGAAGILAHDSEPRDCPVLQVADTLDGLWALGRAARARLACPVVAITGSSGKTTTKTFLAAALGAFATRGSQNNHLGVPLSLARTPADAPAAVFEVGTNHPGEIGPLSKLVSPTLSVLLNVHQAHAENFASLNELRKEKLSIVNGLKSNSYFVVEDRVKVDGIRDDLNCLTFGRSEHADVQLLEVSGEFTRYRLREGDVQARIPGGGEHRALSLAAVLAVCIALNADLDRALDLPDDLVPAGRGNRIEAGGITLIDDSYNANPDSMAAALKSFATQSGRHIAVLGEMLELGDASAPAHRSLAPLCAGLDAVYLVGEGMRPLADELGPSARWHARADSNLTQALLDLLQPGDSLLIKGSNRVFWASGFTTGLIEHLTS